MKDSSKVVMGATLVMVASLAMVLGLILVLLAELYCSLLLRKRRLQTTTSTAHTTTTTPQTPQQDQSVVPPHSSVYAQGVLQAPRRFLFPILSLEEENLRTQNQYWNPQQQVHQNKTQESIASPHRIGLISASSPSNPSQGACTSNGNGGSGAEHIVYISNPIYDNIDSCRPSGVGTTPFETPCTSPSLLEIGEDYDAEPSTTSLTSPPTTPPLTPMKKLPVEACSVSLRDARSLGTSGSDSNSNNGLSSSSSSGSPCTSPSW